ncbi:transposase [Streptomyces sp. NPDC059862]|uniref:transposase n=1 Tax=Streptomyces sp. NPDC059862 TaxID=3346975 RepID=UPI003646ED8A
MRRTGPRGQPGSRHGGLHAAAAGTARRAASARSHRARKADDHSGPGYRAQPAGAARDRTGQRGGPADHRRRQPGTAGQRGILRALCGVSPVEKSSGKSRRRRLNRGGDRQANAALHRIVVTRMRQDERTRLYLERRTAGGKGKREVMRCLKRYAAREVYRLIRADMITRQQPDTSATLMTAA